MLLRQLCTPMRLTSIILYVSRKLRLAVEMACASTQGSSRTCANWRPAARVAEAGAAPAPAGASRQRRPRQRQPDRQADACDDLLCQRAAGQRCGAIDAAKRRSAECRLPPADPQAAFDAAEEERRRHQCRVRPQAASLLEDGNAGAAMLADAAQGRGNELLKDSLFSLHWIGSHCPPSSPAAGAVTVCFWRRAPAVGACLSAFAAKRLLPMGPRCRRLTPIKKRPQAANGRRSHQRHHHRSYEKRENEVVFSRQNSTVQCT